MENLISCYSDYGIFIVGFAEYFIPDKEIKSDKFDTEILRTMFGSLLWDYGRKK